MLTKIIIPIFFVISLLFAGGYFYQQKHQSANNSTETTETDKPLSAYVTEQNVSNPANIQVKGTKTEPTPQQQNTLPEPTQFRVYESHGADTSPSYIDIQKGTGAEAISGNNLAMLYKGYLTDGSIFDESKVNQENKFEAFTFQLGGGQVIKGWDIGIQGMKVGGTRRLIIPSEFGYGGSGQGPIPPNSLLIFDVKLVKIQ